MPGLRIKVNSPILPILIVKLVAMATSLEAFVPRVRSVLADYGGPSAWNLLPDDLTPFPNVTLKFSSTPILAHATPYTFNHYYRHCSRYIRLWVTTVSYLEQFVCLYHRAVSMKALCFWAARTSVHSFDRSDIVSTISHERLEQLRWNWQAIGLFTSPYWWSG